MSTSRNSPVLLHIGASKTATTTLQLNVFSHLSEIIFVGKPFSNLEKQVPGVRKADLDVLSKTVNDITLLTNEDEIFPGLCGVRQLTERISDKSARQLVLSEEALCNNKTVSFESIAKRLHAAFGPADILLTVRNQFAALPSLYLHEMRKREQRVTFESWLAAALADPKAAHRQGESIEQYRYQSALDDFRKVFSGQIKVLLYEDLDVNRARFANQLAELIHVNGDRILSLLDLAPKNVGKSEDWFRYQSLLARYARIKAMLFPRLDLFRALPLLGRIKDAAKAGLQAKAQSAPPMKVEVSAKSRQQIIEYCAADNRRLAESYKLDLGRFGYPGFE